MFYPETVRGSHYAMGQRHGCLFRHVIQANVHRWVMPHTFRATDTAGRLVLETCATVKDALALLRALRPHAALVLGDAGGNLVVFQGYGQRQATAAPEQGLVFATDHVYLPPLVDAGARLGSKPVISRYSRTRFQVLVRARGRAPLTREGMMALCRSHEGYPHSICNDGTAMASLTTTRPGGGQYRLAIADRPPCRTNFVDYLL